MTTNINKAEERRKTKMTQRNAVLAMELKELRAENEKIIKAVTTQGDVNRNKLLTEIAILENENESLRGLVSDQMNAIYRLESILDQIFHGVDDTDKSILDIKNTWISRTKNIY